MLTSSDPRRAGMARHDYSVAPYRDPAAPSRIRVTAAL